MYKSPTATKTDDVKNVLRANKDRTAIFISDPLKGDSIHITNYPVLLAPTCTGTVIDTAGHFLDALDFEAYNGNGPAITLHRV